MRRNSGTASRPGVRSAAWLGACFAAVFASISCAYAPAQDLSLGSNVEIAQRVSAGAASNALCDIDFGSTSRLSAGMEASFRDFTVRAQASLSVYAGSDSLLAPESALYRDPHIAVDVSADELLASWNLRGFGLDAGRSFVNWGVGTFFSPADLYAKREPTGGLPRRKPTDFARFSIYPTDTSRLEIVAAPFDEEDGLYAARAYSALGGHAEGALSLAYRPGTTGEDKVFSACEFSIDSPLAAPHGEVFVSLDPRNLSSIEFKALAGILSRISDLTVLAEYGYDGSAASPHLSFLSLSYPIDEWLALGAAASATLPEGAILLSLTSAVSSLGGFDVSATVSGSGTAAPPGHSPTPAQAWLLQVSLLVSRRF